jgi:hypothetical protein
MTIAKALGLAPRILPTRRTEVQMFRNEFSYVKMKLAMSRVIQNRRAVFATF